MKRIPLSAARSGTPRAYTLVDDEDYDWLSAMGPWSFQNKGYAQAPDGRLMHRIIGGLVVGDVEEVDHINRERLDNRRCNLRVCTRSANAQNMIRSGGSSRFRGVSWMKSNRKWIASAKVDYRFHYLGLFADELEAAVAAQAFRDEHMPFAQPDPALMAALELRKAA